MALPPGPGPAGSPGRAKRRTYLARRDLQEKDKRKQELLVGQMMALLVDHRVELAAIAPMDPAEFAAMFGLGFVAPQYVQSKVGKGGGSLRNCCCVATRRLADQAVDLAQANVLRLQRKLRAAQERLVQGSLAKVHRTWLEGAWRRWHAFVWAKRRVYAAVEFHLQRQLRVAAQEWRRRARRAAGLRAFEHRLLALRNEIYLRPRLAGWSRYLEKLKRLDHAVDETRRVLRRFLLGRAVGGWAARAREKAGEREKARAAAAYHDRGLRTRGLRQWLAVSVQARRDRAVLDRYLRMKEVRLCIAAFKDWRTHVEHRRSQQLLTKLSITLAHSKDLAAAFRHWRVQGKARQMREEWIARAEQQWNALLQIKVFQAWKNYLHTHVLPVKGFLRERERKRVSGTFRHWFMVTKSNRIEVNHERALRRALQMQKVQEDRNLRMLRELNHLRQVIAADMETQRRAAPLLPFGAWERLRAADG